MKLDTCRYCNGVALLNFIGTDELILECSKCSYKTGKFRKKKDACAEWNKRQTEEELKSFNEWVSKSEKERFIWP